MKDEIEDEELTLEEFIDRKMLNWDLESVERMYSVACQCLSERKNRRPLMKEVGVFLQYIDNVRSMNWSTVVCQASIPILPIEV